MTKPFALIALISLVVGVSSAHATSYPWTFHGYVTSFETITAPNTYTDALGTLPDRTLIGSAGFFGGSVPPPPACLSFSSNTLSCGPYACGGYNYASISWDEGFLSPELDNYTDDCPMSYSTFAWGHSRVNGYLQVEDTGYLGNGNYVFEGIIFSFSDPQQIPAGPLNVNSLDGAYWTGAGSFWYTEYPSIGSGTVIDGYQGTFDLEGVTEPAPLSLLVAGLLLLTLIRGSHRAGRGCGERGFTFGRPHSEEEL